MRIKSQRDFWSGVMFVAIGAGFAWAATGYRFGSASRPGPGYFPFGLGVLMALVGLGILAKSLASGEADGDPIGGVAWRPLATILLSVVLFGITLPTLGLVIAMPLLMLGACMSGDEFRWRDVLWTALVLTVGCWLIFVLGLGLTIPMWPTVFSD